jgi:hypothetical protein
MVPVVTIPGERWVNLALGQTAWMVAVLNGAAGRSWPGVAAVGVVIGVHLLGRRDPGVETRRLGAALAAGLVADALLGLSGAVCFTGGAWDGRLPPAWLAALWPCFATYLVLSAAWLQARLGLAAVLGAIGGPLAYAAGGRLGGLTLPAGTVTGLVAIGAVWAVALPLLAWHARRRDGLPARGLIH